VSAHYLPLIALCAVVTYATRYAGLALGKRQPPQFARDFLGYVPVAAFAALVAPDLLSGSDDRLPRLIAAAVASIVVFRFGTLWACIAVGMAVFWAGRWVV
jgi:branched-subunit amino acid transport protein